LCVHAFIYSGGIGEHVGGMADKKPAPPPRDPPTVPMRVRPGRPGPENKLWVELLANVVRSAIENERKEKSDK
jgi:hypothetical protein